MAADPQEDAALMLAGDRLGPYGGQGAAQPGGQLLALLDDHLRGDAIGQVELNAPPVPVAVDVGDPGDAGTALDHLVDGGDAERAERAGDDLRGRYHVGRGQDGGLDDRLAVGPAVPDEHRERNCGQRADRPPAAVLPCGEQDHCCGCGAGGGDLPVTSPGLLAFLVGAQRLVVRGTADGDGLGFELAQVRGVRP